MTKAITLADAQELYKSGRLTFSVDRHGRIVALVNAVKVKVTGRKA